MIADIQYFLLSIQHLEVCYLSNFSSITNYRKFLERRRQEEDNVAQMEEEEREVIILKDFF